MQYTKQLVLESKRSRISIEHKAMADLLAIGWGANDAFMVLGLRKLQLSDDYNKRQLEKTLNDAEFQKYLADMERKVKRQTKKNAAANEQAESEEESEKLDSSSKESIIEHLTKLYKESKDTKQKADILTKIADLQRMKQDENLEEDQLVHFYMPLQCSMCNLYNKAKNEECVD